MDVLQESQPRRRLEFQQEEIVADGDSRIGIDDIDVIHAKIAEKIIPKIGMEFDTEDQAYQFYNTYALEAGFSVRKSKFHNNANGKLLDRLFVCSREGVRGQDKRDNVFQNPRPESRCLCPAKLKINCRRTGRYSVEKFIAEHNHNLSTPSKTHHFRSHRKMSLAQSAEIDMIEDSGIRPKSGFDFMATQGGGRESLGFTHIDYKNHLRTKRTLEIMSGDTSGVLEYLQQKQLEDPSFFYAIQVDEDDLITNIFWADAKMMTDYEDFGDVVSFDTTYRKHKDGRPIALFVGVNHHKQTTIFGAALLYDETAPTFVWLFDTFSKAMNGKLPKTILTDQDAAMAKALVSQWPETYHRLCVWHIFQNAAIHLSHVFAKFKDFSRDFSSCVYDYEHEDDFLHAWNDMLIKYDLQDNDWLKRMFNKKENWALVYGRDTFCADMTTTQRSESMNKVIKHYVSYKHDLRRFFWHFERLLNDRRYDERTADFKADQTNVVLPFPVEILKHAASVYTPTVFKHFQTELSKSYDCTIAENSETEVVLRYIICPYKKHYRYSVTYDTQEDTILCSCRKFEFGGMLCSHALKVFSTRGITRIPNKYILARWKKGKRNGSVMSNNQNTTNMDPKVIVGRRYRDLCRLGMRLSTRAAENEDEYEEVKDTLVKLLERVGLSSNNECVRVQDHNMVVDSTGVQKVVRGIKPKPRSGKSSKRPKGALEVSRKTRKPRAAKDKELLQKEQITHSQVNEVNSTNVQQESQTQTMSTNAQLESQTQIVSTNAQLQSQTQTVEQPQASNQFHSYQALLRMDYPVAESLMNDFLEPMHQINKDNQPHGKERHG